MQKDIRNDFFADELEIEKSINDGIINSSIWADNGLTGGEITEVDGCCQSAKWDTFSTEDFIMIRRH